MSVNVKKTIDLTGAINQLQKLRNIEINFQNEKFKQEYRIKWLPIETTILGLTGLK